MLNFLQTVEIYTASERSPPGRGGGAADGARATFILSRYEDPGNVWSRTRLDLVLADTTYADVSIMIFKSNGFVGFGMYPIFYFMLLILQCPHLLQMQ